MTPILVRVEAPHFCAGLVIDAETGFCLRAAPILAWTVGLPASELRADYARRGWRFSAFSPPPRNPHGDP